MKAGLLFIMAVLAMNIVIACARLDPVKDAAPTPTWLMPSGATMLDSVPMTDGTVMRLYKIKDRCYLATTAGAALRSLTKTWCPDK